MFGQKTTSWQLRKLPFRVGFRTGTLPCFQGSTSTSSRKTVANIPAVQDQTLEGTVSNERSRVKADPPPGLLYDQVFFPRGLEPQVLQQRFPISKRQVGHRQESKGLLHPQVGGQRNCMPCWVPSSCCKRPASVV